MNFYSTYEPVSHPHFFPPPRLSPHSQIHLLVAKSWSPKIALPSEVTPSNRSPHISLSRILRELYITAAMPSSTSVALAAGASALLVAAAYFTKSSQSPPRSMEDIEDIDAEEDCITEGDVVDIFDQLFLQMQSVLAQLSQQIQQIQMSGQQIPEAQLRQLLQQEFERALKSMQGKVFEDNDIDEDCLQEATWEFLEDPEKYPKAKKAVERFQKLYENVTGEKVVGRKQGGGGTANAITSGVDVAADITKDQLLEAAEAYFDALTKAMTNIVMQFKDEGKNLQDPKVAQALNMEFASAANDAGDDALKEKGLTSDGFRAAIEKYSQSPDVGRTLAMLQMKQQQQLQALGIPAM